jgi:dipeptidyl aminopeptidase/acylaminoacyl peptidase
MHSICLPLESRPLFLLVLLTVWPSLGGAQIPSVKQDLAWSQPESEISSPEFSPDGNFIVLETRVHWPDGDEAEGLPDSFFKRLEARQAKDPRFADPVIKLVDLSGRVVCEARYGTHPNVSSDNRKIVFSRQKKPITSLRSLAQTMDGNDIQIIDCETKQARTLAEPNSGFLDNPMFTSDGQSVVYTANEATNGAMSGAVAVERVALESGRKESLLSRETIPAVPCDAVQNKSRRQAFICGKHIKFTSSFRSLVDRLELADGNVIALQARPVPSAGDLYLAETYDLDLMTVFPAKSTLLPLGHFETSRLREVSFQALSGNRLMVLSGYWRAFSLNSKDWLADIGPQNTRPRSFYSPSGEFYLVTEPVDEPDHFSLIRSGDGKTIFVSEKVSSIYGVTWSRDSKRFAVVTLPDGQSGWSYREKLAVYSLQ